jgi:hypothetical protein
MLLMLSVCPTCDWICNGSDQCYPLTLGFPLHLHPLLNNPRSWICLRGLLPARRDVRAYHLHNHWVLLFRVPWPRSFLFCSHIVSCSYSFGFWMATQQSHLLTICLCLFIASLSPVWFYRANFHPNFVHGACNSGAHSTSNIDYSGCRLHALDPYASSYAPALEKSVELFCWHWQ